MRRLHTVWELARADFLERARRFGFLVTLGGAAGLAYTVHAGVWTVTLGTYAPASGPATTGTLVAIVTSVFLALAAFYVVRGTVDRDLRTGVGQILAATPASRLQYAGGKFLSNAAVLGAMVLVLAGLAVAIAAHQGRGISPGGAWSVILPSLLITGPALVAVAGIAVLFDAIPWLRGTAGNFAYFFVWTGILTFAGFDTGSVWADVTGINLVFEGLRDALRAAVPGASPEGLTVSASPSTGEGSTAFPWAGLAWDPVSLARRLGWIGVGATLSGLAAVSLRVFDPFRDPSTSGGASDEGEDEETSPPPKDEHGPSTATEGPGLSLSGLTPASPAGAVVSFLRVVGGELRLLLTGHAWWWYVGLAGANIAALVVPADAASIPLLAAWLIPLSAWSDMGCRERLHGTESLLFSGPRPRLRQMPAQLAAGVALALIAAAGPLARMVLSPDPSGLVAAVAGALFIPSLAFCLGAWSGKEKTFEAIYLLLWYVGPANEVPALDFMGVSGRALESGATPVFLAAALVLGILGWMGRGRRVTRG